MGEEDATYYQRHRDDPDEWGQGTRPKPARRRMAAMVSVRLTPEEDRIVRAAADRFGESISNFMRQAALAASVTRMPITDVSQATLASPTAVARVVGASSVVSVLGPGDGEQRTSMRVDYPQDSGVAVTI